MTRGPGLDPDARFDAPRIEPPTVEQNSATGPQEFTDSPSYRPEPALNQGLHAAGPQPHVRQELDNAGAGWADIPSAKPEAGPHIPAVSPDLRQQVTPNAPISGKESSPLPTQPSTRPPSLWQRLTELFGGGLLPSPLAQGIVEGTAGDDTDFDTSDVVEIEPPPLADSADPVGPSAAEPVGPTGAETALRTVPEYELEFVITPDPAPAITPNRIEVTPGPVESTPGPARSDSVNPNVPQDLGRSDNFNFPFSRSAPETLQIFANESLTANTDPVPSLESPRHIHDPRVEELRLAANNGRDLQHLGFADNTLQTIEPNQQNIFLPGNQPPTY
ncbi:MAG: hypothetical protein ACRC0L_09610, partial [Angustibacter sp.]